MIRKRTAIDRSSEKTDEVKRKRGGYLRNAKKIGVLVAGPELLAYASENYQPLMWKTGARAGSYVNLCEKEEIQKSFVDPRQFYMMNV